MSEIFVAGFIFEELKIYFVNTSYFDFQFLFSLDYVLFFPLFLLIAGGTYRWRYKIISFLQTHVRKSFLFHTHTHKKKVKTEPISIRFQKHQRGVKNYYIFLLKIYSEKRYFKYNHLRWKRLMHMQLNFHH